MAMRIANNIPAMTTQRWLGIAESGLTKSLERLSSGYRINRAADDAAGLAISESFRADIASFRVASRNTSEASSLLQVAEGAMDQIGNMLTRLKELATQASSANAGASEREKIDAEAEQLKTEIERIANVTMYGSTSLLDGTFGAVNSAGTMTGGTEDIRVYGELTEVYSMAGSGLLAADIIVTGLGSNMCAGTWTFSAASATQLKVGNAVTTETITLTWGATGAQTYTFANLGLTFTTDCGIVSTEWSGGTMVIRDTGLTSLNINNANTAVYEFVTAGTGAITLGNGSVTQTISGISPGTAQDLNFDILNVTFSIGTNYTENDLEGVTFTVSPVTGGGGSTFQIGAQNNANNQIAISIDDVRVASLGLTDLDLGTTANAQTALDLVDEAISTLTGSRGGIGAYMNRLLYASANLATTIENVQAAESVIRDVDMASEMTQFTKNQILLQAGTAMLAQANMSPQQVLALFG